MTLNLITVRVHSKVKGVTFTYAYVDCTEKTQYPLYMRTILSQVWPVFCMHKMHNLKCYIAYTQYGGQYLCLTSCLGC